MTTFLLGWLALAIVTTAIFCRLIHNAKVRDEIKAGMNGVFEA